MEKVEDPGDFLAKLGDLHDCTIVSAEFQFAEQRLILSIDDLNWNFEGLPEYPGSRPAQLVFVGASASEDLAGKVSGVSIRELTVTQIDGRFVARLFAKRRAVDWTFGSLLIDEQKSSPA